MSEFQFRQRLPLLVENHAMDGAGFRQDSFGHTRRFEELQRSGIDDLRA